ncbi:hypothetical protein N015_00740 [Pseudomonas asturiensis]|uniref:Toxin CdiA n=1 Tax=Pseudomonas asturiensis TaxID=1190415 RepID=A0ABX6H6F0_9PSED|nr:hypothetical protein [Pseudomonas asturiensis]QHF01008.1 hypothetical protein N015_00740 [Pseudomonas asturiensis]
MVHNCKAGAVRGVAFCEAKRNIITSLVTGIAAMDSASGAATASNAATANVDNNWLATQQEVQYKKELAEAKTISEELRVVAKWEGTSMRQNVLTGTGIAKGFTEGMAGTGLDTLNSAVSFLRDPKESLVAMKGFAASNSMLTRRASGQTTKQLAFNRLSICSTGHHHYCRPHLTELPDVSYPIPSPIRQTLAILEWKNTRRALVLFIHKIHR